MSADGINYNGSYYRLDEMFCFSDYNMSYNSTYDRACKEVSFFNKYFTSDVYTFLRNLVDNSYRGRRYSEPMPWIGFYIAAASLVCIFLMGRDFLDSRTRKLCFKYPCNYFTLNATSLTLIAVAVKLPMDLNNSMTGNQDQLAKLGSMAFLCTMMTNFLPSLATMNSKELRTNIIALDILVITLIVNVCIEIYTGVIFAKLSNEVAAEPDWFKKEAVTFVVMLLFLLIIQNCSALTILKSKEILEAKYQAGHETALKDLERQQQGRLTAEKLKQYVRNHWIMAETGSPQFIIACSSITSASGFICGVSTMQNLWIPIKVKFLNDYQSDYMWSIPLIFWIQYIGSAFGAVTPIYRCYYPTENFKLSLKSSWNHIKVFNVESYGTQKLYDWKDSSIPFSIASPKIKTVIQNFKVTILIICIGIQYTVVVVCKMIALVPILIVIGFLWFHHCWMFKTIFISPSGVLGQCPKHQENSSDFGQYVLKLPDNMELSESTLKRISKSVNCLIEKAEKRQPNNLMKLLEESSSFEGLGKYDSHDVPSLLAEEYLNCWSLPLVSLTVIAISLPTIPHSIVDRFLRSVSEGLTYVTVVEEVLNATDDYVRIQKEAKRLWLEVEVRNKWLGNQLKNHALEVNTTAGEILQRFNNTAKNMVTEVQDMDIGSLTDNSIYRSICANSMYRITKTMLLSSNTNISHKDLFDKLSSMISDILAACLTNLPQAIVMKCHESVIEKRESSVHAAAQLLGETMQIINSLQDRELPNLDTDEFPFIDKWRANLNQPAP